MLNAYSAIAGDVYGLSGVELWVVKLEGQDGADTDILTASSLGSAVQIKADLKGCTVPAWLPLLSEESLPAVRKYTSNLLYAQDAPALDWSILTNCLCLQLSVSRRRTGTKKQTGARTLTLMMRLIYGLQTCLGNDLSTAHTKPG